MVASLTPISRASSGTLRPASCGFRTPIICSSVNGASMKTIDRRIRTLEDRFSLGEPPRLVIVCKSGSECFLDTDRCIQILGECGFLPTTPGIALVNLLGVPDGLNPKELEQFLWEHGAETRGFQGTPK